MTGASLAGGAGTANGAAILPTLLALALALRLAYVFAVPGPLVADMVPYDDIARNLVAGRGFYTEKECCAAPGVGPTYAFRPPLYPMFLALIYGVSGGSVLAARLVQALLGTLSLLLLYFLGRRVFDQPTALLATLLAALYFDFLMYSGMLMAETLYIFLLLLSLLCWLRLLGNPSLPWQVASGASLGLAVLTRPAIVLALPFFLLLFWLHSPRGRRRMLWASAVIGASFILILLPWSLRNYLHFQRPVFIALTGGITLWSGNNPEATGQWYWPPNNPLAGKDEYTQSQLGYQEALRFIVSQPDRFLELSLRRYAWFFDPRDWHYEVGYAGPFLGTLPGMGLLIAWNAFFLGSGLWGGVLAALERRDQGLWLLMVVLLCSLVAAITLGTGNSRFRVPVMPLLLLYAAYFVLRGPAFWQGLRQGKAPFPLSATIGGLWTGSIVVGWAWLWLTYGPSLR